MAALAALLIAACTPPAAPIGTIQPGTSLPPATAATLPIPTRAATPQANIPAPAVPAATLAPARVTVIATHGNVYIRRGPDLGFNPIGALLDGQSATALARDVLSEWVEIGLPDQPGKTGWVSVQTQFTTIDGDLATLPEEQPDIWPVGATIRNCTFHQMLITPGNVIIPSVDNFPANDVRVDPGTYVIVDTDADGYPQVLKVEIREGSAVDIRVDGNGEKKKCPIP